MVEKCRFPCCMQEASVVLVFFVWLLLFLAYKNFLCVLHQELILVQVTTQDWPSDVVLLYATCDSETATQWLREADVQGGATHALMRTAVFLLLLMVLAFQ